MMKFTNISMPEGLWERAHILAIHKRVSFTELIRQAVAAYCDGEHVMDGTIEIYSNGRVHPPEAESVLRGIAAIR